MTDQQRMVTLMSPVVVISYENQVAIKFLQRSEPELTSHVTLAAGSWSIGALDPLLDLTPGST